MVGRIALDAGNARGRPPKILQGLLRVPGRLAQMVTHLLHPIKKLLFRASPGAAQLRDSRVIHPQIHELKQAAQHRHAFPGSR